VLHTPVKSIKQNHPEVSKRTEIVQGYKYVKKQQQKELAAAKGHKSTAGYKNMIPSSCRYADTSSVLHVKNLHH